ncbi:type VI secretion system baseplate subunit TssF [Klebsiella pneumoniae]|nr:type VI secretion system baseplate subunit TssF [Klebsiella pneumoniae]
MYSADSVTGSGRTGERRVVPFTRFRHLGGMMRRHAPERYYHTRVKRGRNRHARYLAYPRRTAMGGWTGSWRGKRSPCASPALTASCCAGRYRARCWNVVSRYQPRRLPSAISVSPRCWPIPRRKTATTGGT